MTGNVHKHSDSTTYSAT